MEDGMGDGDCRIGIGVLGRREVRVAMGGRIKGPGGKITIGIALTTIIEAQK